MANLKLRLRLLLMLLTVLSGFSGSAQYTLFDESFENGGEMPAGWNKTTISGTDALSFVTHSSYPDCFGPPDGDYFVRFASYIYEVAVNRLFTQTPFTTMGKSDIQLEFAWAVSYLFADNNDNVTVQYSLDGTNWIDVINISRVWFDNRWWQQVIVLPSAIDNQPKVYLSFLFTSAYGNDCYLDDVKIKAMSVVNSEDIEINTVNVYPNPSNNVVNIELTNDIAQIAVYNSSGQVIYEQITAQDKNIQLNFSHHDAGAYLIRFVTLTGESFIRKFAVI